MQTITKTQPEKSLTSLLPKKSGRNNRGRVTVKGVGGREKRFYRQIDWKRDLRDLTGRVIAIEYDPGRNLNIALINYTNGKKRYILLPIGLAVGDKVISGALVDVKVGNALPLSSIPVGTPIHNIELSPGRGAQLARTAGSVAQIIAKEGKFAHIKMPSGELRMVSLESFATVGQLSNEEWKNVILGTAGRARHMGRRPKVRGTAQNPRSHPHGGGEGRSGEGMHPKTAQGKPARGKKTRKRNKYSNKYILEGRRGRS